MAVASAASLSGLRVDHLLPGRRPAHVHVHVEQTVCHAADIMSYTEADALPVLEEGRASRRGGDRSRVAAVAGRPAQREPADTRPQAPLTVLPGPSPLRGYRGTAVP
ncbi:hypothetical protein [Streptomyces bluensis]|uniref:hypothetical protein n=1 Tax=Streptomyces bluensis TaxID=33897 RepID=UPI00331D6EB8